MLYCAIPYHILQVSMLITLAHAHSYSPMATGFSAYLYAEVPSKLLVIGCCGIIQVTASTQMSLIRRLCVTARMTPCCICACPRGLCPRPCHGAVRSLQT